MRKMLVYELNLERHCFFLPFIDKYDCNMKKYDFFLLYVDSNVTELKTTYKANTLVSIYYHRNCPIVALEVMNPTRQWLVFLWI